MRAVVPIPLHTTSLRPSVLREIFSFLSKIDTSTLPAPDETLVPSIQDLQARIRERSGKPIEGELEAGSMNAPREDEEDISTDLDREMIYMAITTTDSTVVYYKLSKGIKKPADIPDE